ncbi:MAG: DUF2383 domain-containing protein [Thermoanaerobacteraceae bacterium]
MQEITQQEMILNAFIELDEIERVILDKIKNIDLNIFNNSTANILSDIEKMAKNHIDKILNAKKVMNINSLIKKNMSQEPIDILQELNKYLINLQSLYNANIINITNPYIRELFTELREETMKAISLIQISIVSIESKPVNPNSIIK